MELSAAAQEKKKVVELLLENGIKEEEEEEEEEAVIYHERQRLQFCLLHALNNVFQFQAKDSFTRNELDAIAEKLALDDPDKQAWTPLAMFCRSHYNMLTGNYDVNVLIAAVKARGKSVIWHDRRSGASSLNLNGCEETLTGILLNVPVKRLGGLWRSRHWIALRKIDGLWHNLDSDLPAPKPFSCEDDVIRYIDVMIGEGAEVFVISHGRK